MSHIKKYRELLENIENDNFLNEDDHKYPKGDIVKVLKNKSIDSNDIEKIEKALDDIDDVEQLGGKFDRSDVHNALNRAYYPDSEHDSGKDKIGRMSNTSSKQFDKVKKSVDSLFEGEKSLKESVEDDYIDELYKEISLKSGRWDRMKALEFNKKLSKYLIKKGMIDDVTMDYDELNKAFSELDKKEYGEIDITRRSKDILGIKEL